MHFGPAAPAEANRDLHIGVQKINPLGGCVQPQIQIGEAPLEIRQSRQQPLLQEGRQHTDGQGASTPLVARLIDGALELHQRVAQPRDQTRPFPGEFYGVTTAHEQRYAQVILERAHLHADGGGRDAKPLCGARKRQLFGRGDEYPQAAQWQPRQARARWQARSGTGSLGC
jgi:hypothetical protein